MVKRSAIVDFAAQLFPKQRAFVDDRASRKAALCTRRAGKSVSASRVLAQATQDHPGEIALYISLTRDSAKRIMWPELVKMNDKQRLGWDMSESSLTVKTPNGSLIILVGADAVNIMDRLRGAKYSVVVIDEAQGFRAHLQALVEDVLEPACLDLRATIYLLGTPGPIPNGYFYDATNGQHGYSVHRWSVLDNPFMQHAKNYIDDMLVKRGWTRDNPTFRREWLGEWVIDLDALVYRFRRSRNVYSDMPKGVTVTRIMGMDYGWNDKTTWSIVAYSDRLPDTWIQHVEGGSEMIPSQIAETTLRLIKQFSPSEIVADTGGLGKSITEEMIRRYSLPIKPAEKTEKLTNIHLMNGDFIDGNLRVHASCVDLISEYETLVKNAKGKEQDGMANDYCDSSLYAWRKAKAYAHVPVKELDEYERAAAEEDAMEKQLENRLMRQKEPWWAH